jgi:chromosome segregation ATPase
VALDGSVIAKNGNMTGGSGGGDRDMDRGSRWDEKALKELQSRRDALLQQEEGLRRRIQRGRTGDTSSLVVMIEDLETALRTVTTR